MAVMLLGVASCGAADQALTSGDQPEGSPSEQPAATEVDDAPEPWSSTVVLAGDFDGYPWELSVDEFDSLGPCLSLTGAPLPREGDQLASGACSGPLEGLQWQSTSAAAGIVAFGHAPAEAATVELRNSSEEPVALELHEHADFPQVKFFVSRVPDGFGPEEAVALDAAGREVASRPILTADPLDLRADE